jgi:hypothetical protein
MFQNTVAPLGHVIISTHLHSTEQHATTRTNIHAVRVIWTHVSCDQVIKAHESDDAVTVIDLINLY